MTRTSVLGLVLVVCGALLIWRMAQDAHAPSLAPKPSAAATATRASSGAKVTEATTVQTRVIPPAAVTEAMDTEAGPAQRLGAFSDWSKRYVAASPDERVALAAEGVRLAEARRPVLKALIKSDPRRALKQAVPMVVRQELPREVLALLEERVNGRAALRVYQGVGADNRSPVPTTRIAEFADGRTFQTYAYGRRGESVRWLAEASLNGVALDREFALHEDAFRPLELGERPDPAKPAVAVCPVSGKSSLADEDKGRPITEETPALEAFGEIVYLCNGAHAIVYREQLIYAEGGTGGPQAFTGILPAAPTPSIGNVRVLVIPLTFADQNDTPSTETVLYQLMRDVGDHYAKASYGKLTLLPPPPG